MKTTILITLPIIAVLTSSCASIPPVSENQEVEKNRDQDQVLAQSNMLSVQRFQLEQRINLYLALGGNG